MTYSDAHIRSIVDHDGAVILDPENDAFYGANSTGAYIWSRLIRGEAVEQIARDLAADTATELERVLPDVEAFIQDLKDKRLFRFGNRA